MDEATARGLARAARQAQEWLGKRDALICKAVADGAGVREVARAVGLTHPSIIKIVDRQKNPSIPVSSPKDAKHPAEPA